MFNRIHATVLTTLIAALILSACGRPIAAATSVPIATTNAKPAEDTATVPSPIAHLPVFSHVFIIVLENKAQSSIVNSPDAPYLNQLAAQYGHATRFYGIRHPSLPNYLALTGGDTFSITSDCRDCFVASDNIIAKLEAAGRSWKAYMESMPHACFIGDASPFYRQKHNPFIYYDNVQTDPARCNKIVPFTEFETDLRANALPDYTWITPNMCNDMHSCPISTGDTWLHTWVPEILASSAWQDKGVLFITFDEGRESDGCCSYAAGGLIDTLVVSPLVQPGFTSDVPYDHYSLLRTIEEAWGLPLLGKAGCDCTTPMADFFAPTPTASH